MKNKRTLAIAAVFVALAAIATIAVFKNTQSVQAQTDELPVVQRFSFGMVGIAAGQTMRVNVSNIIAMTQIYRQGQHAWRLSS